MNHAHNVRGVYGHERVMATRPKDTGRLSLASAIDSVFPWVVFDMDGTLANSFELIVGSFNYAAGKFMDKPITKKDAISIPGGTLEEQLGSYVPSGHVFHAVERYHAYYRQHFDRNACSYGGIDELLFTLKRRGVNLAVYTGADEESAQFTLQKLGLSRFFSTIVTGGDVRKPKPDPEGLRIVMNATGARSNQMTYVGDHPNDVKASRNAGIKSAAAYWGSLHKEELETLEPDFGFRHPSEAVALLESA